MYKLLLIFKYLRKRRIAWVSLGAVTLCTAMVLVVISVMGGWLRMFRETSHGLVGDLVVSRQVMQGFPHYEEMIAEFSKLPEFKAAAPIIQNYGLLDVNDQGAIGVEVEGLDIDRIKDVNGFARSLHLQPNALENLAKECDAEVQKDLKNAATTQSSDDRDTYKIYADEHTAEALSIRAKAATFPSWQKLLPPAIYKTQFPRALHGVDVSKYPGMIVGAGVVGLRPDVNGKIARSFYEYLSSARLTVVQSDSGAASDPRQIGQFWIIDDSRTGNFAADAHTVYVPFDYLQAMLGMDDKPGDPARCNEIAISLKPGFSPDDVKPKIKSIVDEFGMKYSLPTGKEDDAIFVQTWEEQQGEILSAVEHEKSLLVILFAIISVVAIFLIFCIFFMIVVEKTRDIGIIKSVGATGPGVAAIFLGYGLVIGIVGAGLGLLMGYGIVHNINWLHAELTRITGVPIWDPRTYVFDTIPNTMDPTEVVVIVSVAVLSSVLGALVPAIRAARMNPVQALRWE